MSAPLFAFHDVALGPPDRRILSGVTVDIPHDGVTVIAGPSGAGKTTLLRLCNRLAVPDAGKVCFRGADIAGLDPLAHRRRVGMVFQRPALFAGTVRDNMCVARPDGDQDVFVEALARASLSADYLDRPAAQLSGGEAQRACLARTLVTRPEVLLLDEPTAALDARPRRAFEAVARRLADDGVPIVWVTHDLDQLHRMADHLLVIDGGGVAYTGPVEGATGLAAITADASGSGSGEA